MTDKRRRNRTRGSAGEAQRPETSSKELECRETSPSPEMPGKRRKKIVGPRKEDHKYAVPWAMVE